ncbi:GFA family protein [Marimonas arenosa]|uniref:GFA family protein n=1 Tax=Marimonas arenosa TaxID=1795305 RepID=A0AAE4B4N8_9RHOB|nr:GFA family protein [Marimonas arenosa]MDQ2090425.1 GFA family protein [Marimonas arenosa]
MHKGSCLCGAVQITIAGELAPPNACHCSQCRKQSGHFWASTDLPMDRVTIRGEANVTWFNASEIATRGFCRSCGSFLFWKRHGRGEIAVAMGAIDSPTGTQLSGHIFSADKGDYYDIADGLPKSET